MDNVSWSSINDYDDIQSHGQYDLAREEGFSDSEAMKLVHRYSRDNARTPMQWTRQHQAGFTEGTPWLPVHDDYRNCCVESEAKDENSVLAYYRKLWRVRSDSAASDILQQGDYQEILQDSKEIYAFKRELAGREVVTLVNFADHEVTYDLAELAEAKQVISSQDGTQVGVLRPYEAVCYLVKAGEA